jgi:TRAP-type C4-dicarboxylate transport system permease small subunit
VTEEGDEAAPDKPADIPPTRKHDAPAAAASARASLGATDPGGGGQAAAAFPDDGAIAAIVRKLDGYLGQAEQALLFALLASVVLVAAIAAIHDKVVDSHLGRWWHYVVRGGTFSIAMLGAVFATHQQRHLAMDLISRRISPRSRLVLGIVLKLFTIGVAVLLFRSGMHQRDAVGGSESLDLGFAHINDQDIVTTMPIGAAMIILHSLLHLAIDVDYLARGKLLPERARSGH